ncbi:MAG: helix-turn-helix domain-containing protein [Pseudonocardiaceae bacterium]
MDTTDPIWRTHAVHEAAAAGDVGILIRVSRTAQNLTLVQAGPLCGYSASTLSRIETGRQPLTDVALLRHFAEVFHIPLQLFGLAPTATTSSPIGVVPASTWSLAATVSGTTAREDGEDPVRRRNVLSGLVAVTGGALLGVPGHAASAPPGPLLRSPSTTTAQPVSAQALRSSLVAARSLFHGCRYSDLAVALPDLITTAQVSCDAATGDHHETVSTLLADSYSLAANLCTRLHDNALAWVTADRARSAAHTSGNIASIAEAARVASIALRRHDHHDTAITLLTDTALRLGDGTGTAARDLLGAYGALLCTASYTAAQNGNRSQALELIGEAEDAARRLDGPITSHSTFNSTNVAVYQIGVRTALGDSGTALDYARRIEIRSLPTPERQARLCLDTARAWHRFGDLRKCYQALRAAEHLAPEELRRPSVRSLVAGLLHTPGPAPADLRAFTARIQAQHLI